MKRVVPFALAMAVGAQTYTTTFDRPENPLLENGAWINGRDATGLWANIKTVGGVAKGCGNFPNWWLDATAVLAGTWGPDQTVQATVWRQRGSDNDQMEVEIRLRSSLGPDCCNGYEVLFTVCQTNEAYMYIVRWNGPQKDFTILKQEEGSSWGVKHGDTVKATIIGNVITAYVNGIQKMQATDNTFTTGSPGIGFDENRGNTADNFGFSDFTATATGGPVQAVSQEAVRSGSASWRIALPEGKTTTGFQEKRHGSDALFSARGALVSSIRSSGVCSQTGAGVYFVRPFALPTR